jgi:NTE family protein
VTQSTYQRPANCWRPGLATFSPSQLNPFDLNPLRSLLERQVDFEQLRARSPFKLFVGTTQANTGKVAGVSRERTHRRSSAGLRVLPMIHHAVEIDGEPYWDGGYSANPAVFPLFYDCDSRDVLLVLLSPLKHENTPSTVAEIEARIVELALAPTSCAKCECSLMRPSSPARLS